MEQIRYLKQEEKQNTRQMYEAIFPEDSKSFIDYYYQWKTRDNQILVMEDNADYEVMMHFNPYMVSINGKKAKIPYIVAVATRPDCRRQGKMQQVMKRVLQDLQRTQCPFTFLLPANPAYYYGQDFVFSSENQKKTVKCSGVAAEWESIPLENTNYSQVQQAAELANAILAEQYDVYVQRDADYYERLLEEVASEQGKIFMIKENEQFVGILAYGGEEKAEIKEFLLFLQYEARRSEICDRIFGIEGWKEEEMRMMIRITDLQSWDGILKGEPEVLIAEVTDSMVEANNGIWRMEWNPQGGCVTRLMDAEDDRRKEREAETDTEPMAGVEKILHMHIAELTKKIVEKMSIFIREWV